MRLAATVAHSLNSRGVRFWLTYCDRAGLNAATEADDKLRAGGLNKAAMLLKENGSQ
jgi:hypothetical protein